MDSRAEEAPGSDDGGLSTTERAVLGPRSESEAVAFFSAYTCDRLGAPIRAVQFRAGRIDVVWGVELDDGREVVIKAYRQPVDLAAVAAATEAKRVLRVAGFPCPEPLSGPDEVDGQVLVAETRLGEGSSPDGRVPENRRLLAAGLARHIELLRGRSDLLGPAGRGPSWCQYHSGPWPVPHDPIVDFSATPDGYAWLDAWADRVARQILTNRAADDLVIGHADWYAGNTAVADGALVGTYDWELVADAEAVIAGFTAACYAASSTSGAGLSTPEEVAAFLHDYDHVRGEAFSSREQRAAAAAAAWILAFNARWQVGLGEQGDGDGSGLDLVRQRGEDYLTLTW